MKLTPRLGPLPRGVAQRLHPAPRRAAAAKRAVFSGVVAVLLLNAGLNVALDTTHPEYRDPEYGHRLKELRKLRRDHPTRPLVVVLGSSRSQMGLSPAHLGLGDGPADPLVYNLSQAGCGPVHELLNLRRLLADGVAPEFVLVEVLRPVLAGTAPAEKLLNPARLSLADVRRAAPLCDDPADLRDRWAAGRACPWWTFRLTLLSHWGGSLLPWQQRQDFMWKKLEPGGWLPYFYDDISPERRAQGTADAQAQYAGYFVADYRVAPLADRAYRELLDECRRRHVRAGFVVMPEGPTFRGWYPPGAEVRATDYLRGLSREYDVPVFDAAAWLPDDTAFADGHHLMRHGAAAFSRRFGAECIGPWVRGRR